MVSMYLLSLCTNGFHSQKKIEIMFSSPFVVSVVIVGLVDIFFVPVLVV